MSKTEYVQQFDFGKRIEELIQNADPPHNSPTKLAKHLGFEHRNQLYHRFKKDDLHFKELLMICDWFKINLDEFFQLEPGSGMMPELEDHSDRYKNTLEYRIEQLENFIKGKGTKPALQ